MLMKTPSALVEAIIARATQTNKVPGWKLISYQVRRGIAKKPNRRTRLEYYKDVPILHKGTGRIYQSPLLLIMDAERRKYTGEKLRAIRAERGCGNPRKIKK